MKETQEPLDNLDAAQALESIVTTQQQITTNYRPPLLLTIFASLSYALIVFSWGMTEHENLWALGMYGGAIALFISLALNIYTLRIMGVKPNILPKNKTDIKFHIAQAAIFGMLIIAGREIRLIGFEFAPHLAAVVSGILFGYLLYKYPLGGMPVAGDKHE